MINPVINLYPYAHPQVYTLYNNILFIVYELLYNYHVKISSYISKTTTNKQITFLCNNNNLLNCVLIGREVIHSVDSLSLILFFSLFKDINININIIIVTHISLHHMGFDQLLLFYQFFFCLKFLMNLLQSKTTPNHSLQTKVSHFFLRFSILTT